VVQSTGRRFRFVVALLASQCNSDLVIEAGVPVHEQDGRCHQLNLIARIAGAMLPGSWEKAVALR